MKHLTKTLTSLFAFILVITGAICLTACGDKKTEEKPTPTAITVTIASDNEINEYHTYTGKYLSTVLSENDVEINNDNSIGFYLDANFTSPFDNSKLTKNTIVFTKMATLDKITINGSGGVKAKNTSISGEVVLPRSVKYFDQDSSTHDGFKDCTQITSIIISSELNNRYDGYFYRYPIFRGCTKLNNITVVADNEDFSSENGVLFNKDKTELLSYPKANTETIYQVPQSVKTICYNAFNDCDNLETIVLPNTLERVGQSAFYGCDNLKVLTWPNTIKYFDVEYNFAYCPSLGYVYISENLKTFGYSMFQGCTALEKIFIDSPFVAELMDSFLEQNYEEATTKIYIKTGLNIVSDSSDADSFVNNFTKQATSDKTGYDMYVRNAK